MTTDTVTKSPSDFDTAFARAVDALRDHDKIIFEPLAAFVEGGRVGIFMRADALLMFQGALEEAGVPQAQAVSAREHLGEYVDREEPSQIVHEIGEVIIDIAVMAFLGEFDDTPPILTHPKPVR